MYEIQKCPNLIRVGGVSIFQKYLKFKDVPISYEGGGKHFSKKSEIKICPKGWRGGDRSTLIGTLSQIFSIFYFDASPKII